MAYNGKPLKKRLITTLKRARVVDKRDKQSAYPQLSLSMQPAALTKRHAEYNKQSSDSNEHSEMFSQQKRGPDNGQQRL
jgi:hypothetical protein